MKFLTIILVAVAVTGVLMANSKSLEQQKPVTLVLTQEEAVILYNSLDNAPIAGEIRKPILQKITLAYQASLSQPGVNDSTKTQGTAGKPDSSKTKKPAPF